MKKGAPDIHTRARANARTHTPRCGTAPIFLNTRQNKDASRTGWGLGILIKRKARSAPVWCWFCVFFCVHACAGVSRILLPCLALSEPSQSP